MGQPGVMKRRPVLPRTVSLFHDRVPKSVLHEALLDLWLEHHCMDVHPNDVPHDTWVRYEEDVMRRSDARRRQG